MPASICRPRRGRRRRRVSSTGAVRAVNGRAPAPLPQPGAMAMRDASYVDVPPSRCVGCEPRVVAASRPTPAPARPASRTSPGDRTSQRAAASAPCANVARSRTVCVSVTVSAGPSNPTVCVPGNEAGTRRRRRRLAAAYRLRLHRIAQHQRGAGRRVALGRVVLLVDEGAVVVRAGRTARRPARTATASRFAPSEKFADATTPMPAALDHGARTRPRAPPQPVVPMTTFTPRPRGAVTLASTASAVVKSIATSTPAQVAPIDGAARCRWRPTSTTPATSNPAAAACCSTSRPMRP